MSKFIGFVISHKFLDFGGMAALDGYVQHIKTAYCSSRPQNIPKFGSDKWQDKCNLSVVYPDYMGLACFHTNHGKLWIELAPVEDCELPKEFIDSDAHMGSRPLVRPFVEEGSSRASRRVPS